MNGTSALHLALQLAGVQPGDEVLVSTLTFIAPVNAIRYCGGHPVFMDAERTSWNMDPEKVVEFLERGCSWTRGCLVNRMTGRRIAAILPVHILGHPVDIDPILEAARSFEVPVVEDAAESLGALYKGKPVGAFGDSACFSFNGNKIITCGGGGMIVTKDPSSATRARHLSTQAKAHQWEYLHDEVGYNYRLVNLLAAVGVAQLEQLPTFIRRKREIADRYEAALRGVEGLTLMPEASWARSTFWLYTILVDGQRFPLTRDGMMERMTKEGIQVRPMWYPIHRQRMYQGEPAYRIEVADDLHRSGLSLPCSVGLSDSDQEKVIGTILQLAEQTERSVK
jgi:perosamine synthetase